MPYCSALQMASLYEIFYLCVFCGPDAMTKQFSVAAANRCSLLQGFHGQAIRWIWLKPSASECKTKDRTYPKRRGFRPTVVGSNTEYSHRPREPNCIWRHTPSADQE